ncbi:MAG: hypothetical protein E7671_00475, partial [Ruminococcaceae bacterium]|nr:hypothetical protein [Oscillospiraceae bacterium]
MNYYDKLTEQPIKDQIGDDELLVGVQKSEEGKDIVVRYPANALKELKSEKAEEAVKKAEEASEKAEEAAKIAAEKAAKEAVDKVLDGTIGKMNESTEKRLTNLEHQVSPEYFETDETVAYEKAVPANACPYAELHSVGGMTHKSNNLIPFPYDVASGSMMGGLPLTIDGGVITVGTGTAAGGYANLCHSLTLPAGTYT